MKKDLFQLDKSYPGNLRFKEQELSCVLWFEELKIFLTITSIDLELDIDLGSNEELFGYTATEEGIMYFRSHNFFSTYISSNKKTYLLNDFVVSKSIQDYQDLIIESISFGFDNLISLDNYLSLKAEKRKLEFDFNFDKIILLEDGKKEVSVVNQVNRSFKHNSEYLFTLAITPFIFYKFSERIKIKHLHSYSECISWFLQLIFGNRQKVVYITFSGRGAHKEGDGKLEFQYFHSEILRASNKSLLKKHVNRPLHNLTDMLPFLKSCYGKWDRLFEEKPILIRLFFNEINSKRIISDDRFKNLCSIIQGLDKFCIIRKETDFRNKKIRGPIRLSQPLRSYIRYLYHLIMNEFSLRKDNEFDDIGSYKESSRFRLIVSFFAAVLTASTGYPVGRSWKIYEHIYKKGAYYIDAFFNWLMIYMVMEYIHYINGVLDKATPWENGWKLRLGLQVFVAILGSMFFMEFYNDRSIITTYKG